MEDDVYNRDSGTLQINCTPASDRRRTPDLGNYNQDPFNKGSRPDIKNHFTKTQCQSISRSCSHYIYDAVVGESNPS